MENTGGMSMGFALIWQVIFHTQVWIYINGFACMYTCAQVSRKVSNFAGEESSISISKEMINA